LTVLSAALSKYAFPPAAVKKGIKTYAVEELYFV